MLDANALATRVVRALALSVFVGSTQRSGPLSVVIACRLRPDW
jgi:hypothetical protein